MNPFALFLSMTVVFGSISAYESCHPKDKPMVKKPAPVAINFDSFYLTSHGPVQKENSAITQNADLWFEEIDSTHTLMKGGDTLDININDIKFGGTLSPDTNITGIKHKSHPHNTASLLDDTIYGGGAFNTNGGIGMGGQLTLMMKIEGNSDVMVYDSAKLIAYQKHDSTMVIIGDSATVIRVLLESMDYTRKLKVKYPKQ